MKNVTLSQLQNDPDYEQCAETLFALFSALYVAGNTLGFQADVDFEKTITNPLVTNPGIFFYPAAKTNSVSYANNVKRFDAVSQQLIKYYPNSNLEKLFNDSREIFLEAIRYGFRLNSDFKSLSAFISQAKDFEVIEYELSNLACMTVELASYFQSATQDLDMHDNQTFEVLDELMTLGLMRYGSISLAHQSFGRLGNDIKNGKRFVNYYTQIKEIGLNSDDILEFITKHETTDLEETEQKIIRENNTDSGMTQ